MVQRILSEALQISTTSTRWLIDAFIFNGELWHPDTEFEYVSSEKV
jgi:hypothetical protein